MPALFIISVGLVFVGALLLMLTDFIITKFVPNRILRSLLRAIAVVILFTPSVIHSSWSEAGFSIYPTPVWFTVLLVGPDFIVKFLTFNLVVWLLLILLCWPVMLYFFDSKARDRKVSSN